MLSLCTGNALSTMSGVTKHYTQQIRWCEFCLHIGFIIFFYVLYYQLLQSLLPELLSEVSTFKKTSLT